MNKNNDDRYLEWNSPSEPNRWVKGSSDFDPKEDKQAREDKEKEKRDQRETEDDN
jgi:hypothetical protein